MKNRKKFCFALFCYGLIDIRQDFLKIVLSLLTYFPWENLLVYNYLLTTLFYQKFLGILPIFSSSSPGLKQWLFPSFEQWLSPSFEQWRQWRAHQEVCSRPRGKSAVLSGTDFLGPTIPTWVYGLGQQDCPPLLVMAFRVVECCYCFSHKMGHVVEESQEY